jgi:hypothetical protein
MVSFNHDSSLDILLHKLFDYAGMFPPAERSFSEALSESASFAQELERPWLVGSDIVLDVASLKKLTSEALAAAGFLRPVSVCVLASDPAQDTIKAITETRNCRISSIEAKVTPASLQETVAAYAPLANRLGALLAVEPDLSQDSWQDVLETTVAHLATQRFKVALKCRCSGPTGIGSDRVAAAIASASDRKLAFKVTGGLHHPIVEPGEHSFPMGFLNVAAAVVIRRHCGEKATEALLAQILTNDSIAQYSSGTGLSFEDISLTSKEVHAARAQAHLSVGSCNLHEPDSDLSRLFS